MFLEGDEQSSPFIFIRDKLKNNYGFIFKIKSGSSTYLAGNG